MNKYLFLICLIAICCSFSSCKTVQLSGVYLDNEGNYLVFKPHRKIEFSITRNTGFGPHSMMGSGSYYLRKDKIVIKSKFKPIFKDSQSTYFYIPTNKKNCFNFEIFNAESQPFVGVSFITGKDSILLHANNKGYVKYEMTKFQEDSIVEIGISAYDTIKIKISNYQGGEFRVIMRDKKFDYMENYKLTLSYKIENDTIDCSYSHINYNWLQLLRIPHLSKQRCKNSVRVNKLVLSK